MEPCIRLNPSIISKIREVYGEALPQVHTYKGVSTSGEHFHALFDRIRCGFLCSVGMEGSTEGNPQLSPLAVPWFLLWGDLGEVLDSQTSGCTPAAWTFGHEGGLRQPKRNPWNTRGVGMESTALIGLNPCSFGAAVQLNTGDL